MAMELRIVSLVSLAVGMWIFLYSTAVGEVGRTRLLGLRGLKRRRALEKAGLFAGIETGIRVFARWSVLLPLGATRKRIDEMLEHGGDWMGFDADEFLGASTLGGVFGLLLGGFAAWTLELSGLLVPFLGGLGLIMPYVLLTGEIQKRAKTINRALPGAIDLASLCMTAGLSFPQSLRQVVSKSGDSEDPLNEELSLILQELYLGWTRKRALERFAERVPASAVRSFVSTVVQSEERGTPLSQVLQIQATTLRQRRSQSGEEAASRAAVLMLVPLMLIMASVIVLLMGPFVIQGMNSGF